jgi:hypothetical protein
VGPKWAKVWYFGVTKFAFSTLPVLDSGSGILLSGNLACSKPKVGVAAIKLYVNDGCVIPKWRIAYGKEAGVMKRYISVESQTMFGKNVNLVFGIRITRHCPGTGPGMAHRHIRDEIWRNQCSKIWSRMGQSLTPSRDRVLRHRIPGYGLPKHSL